MIENKISYETTGLFAMVSHSFIKESKKMKFHTRWLYVALLYYRNTKNGLSFPSYDTIQNLTGLRREKISMGFTELKENGWIKTKKRRFGNSTIYEIILSKNTKD